MAQRDRIRNECAKNLCKRIFSKLKKDVRTTEELKELTESLPFSKEIERLKPGSNYPRLHFKVDQSDVSALKEQGYLNHDNRFSNRLASSKDLTPLEKVLFSIIWKNGDYGKEHHVIQGVIGESSAAGESLVFYNFGRYLCDKATVPVIVDQHTLRAFAIYKTTNEDISDIRRTSLLNKKKHEALVAKYIRYMTFIRDDMGSSSDGQKEEFFYEVDRLLFGVGKLLKQ